DSHTNAGGDAHANAGGTTTPRNEHLEVFKVAVHHEGMVLLQVNEGNIQLLIGAPVSEETKIRATRDSIFLVKPLKPEPHFELMYDVIARINEAMVINRGYEPYDEAQNLLNREVPQMGDFVFLPLDLNTDLSVDQLTDFLFMVWSSLE